MIMMLWIREVTVDLSVGQYLIEMSPDDPRDANASDYYRVG